MSLTATTASDRAKDESLDQGQDNTGRGSGLAVTLPTLELPSNLASRQLTAHGAAVAMAAPTQARITSLNQPDCVLPRAPALAPGPARQYDMDGMLRAAARAFNLSEGMQRACYSNPGLMHLNGSLYYWHVRGWVPPRAGVPCKGPTARYGVWTLKWQSGDKVDLHAVIRHDVVTGQPLHVVQVSECRSYEDARAIRVSSGPTADKYLMYTEWSAEGACFMAVARLHIRHRPGAVHKKKTSAARKKHRQQAGAQRGLAAAPAAAAPAAGARWMFWTDGSMALIYKKAMHHDKNWVPLDGTTLVAYPSYPSFEPHGVFNFGSFDMPVTKEKFDFVASVQFMQRMHHLFNGTVRLSGSTPAVLEPGGGSYLAVGHAVVPAPCFAYYDQYGHNETVFAPDKLLRLLPRFGQPGCEALSANATANLILQEAAAAAAAAAAVATTSIAGNGKAASAGRTGFWRTAFTYNGKPFNHTHHHESDYWMFLYRLSSSPPYQLTHISHGFKPLAALDAAQPGRAHLGVVFPLGLARLPAGGSWLVSYGEDDHRAKLLVLPDARVEALLEPLQGLDPLSYRFCSLVTQP